MSFSNILVSIILPNFNHERYLEERLNSIFNQTYLDFEVIILDDASTDKSLSILNNYKNHPKVSNFIVNEVNTGSPFKQWQKGLKLAKGEFIWIAESDDCCDLDFLEKQIMCIESSDVAVAKTMAIVENVIHNEVIHPVFDETKQVDAILYCPILNVSSVLFKSQLIRDFETEFYINFNVIGDRVFYFEYFRNADTIYNRSTTNYFRKSSSSISKLNGQNLAYYKRYFNEHCKFMSYAKMIDANLTPDIRKRYIQKFYNRVSSRTDKTQKYTFAYLQLFLLYKLRLLMR